MHKSLSHRTKSAEPVGCGSCLLLLPAGVDILAFPDRKLQVTSDVKMQSLHLTWNDISLSSKRVPGYLRLRWHPARAQKPWRPSLGSSQVPILYVVYLSRKLTAQSRKYLVHEHCCSQVSLTSLFELRTRIGRRPSAPCARIGWCSPQALQPHPVVSHCAARSTGQTPRPGCDPASARKTRL